jgi:hypothetical protein
VTAYTTGQPTLASAVAVESPQGTLASNTGIIPAGSNGSIDVYASDPTDLVVDVNGYFVSLDFALPGISTTEGTNPINQTSFFAAGIRGVTTGNNDAIPVVIDSNGQEHKQVQEQAEAIRLLEARLVVLEKALLSGR